MYSPINLQILIVLKYKPKFYELMQHRIYFYWLFLNE